MLIVVVVAGKTRYIADFALQQIQFVEVPWLAFQMGMEIQIYHHIHCRHSPCPLIAFPCNQFAEVACQEVDDPYWLVEIDQYLAWKQGVSRGFDFEQQERMALLDHCKDCLYLKAKHLVFV